MISQPWRPSLPGLVIGVALVGFVLWIASVTEWVEKEVAREDFGPTASDDLYVLKKVLQPIGVKIVEREDLSELPPSGATLLLRGWSWGLLPERDRALHDWVDRGGSLVIESGLLTGQHASWIPIDFEQRRPAKKPTAAPTEPRESVDPPRVIRGQLQHACHKVAEPDGVPPAYAGAAVEGLRLCVGGWRLSTPSKALWALADDDGKNEILRIALGAGSVTALGGFSFNPANVFGNSGILEGDNALIAVAALQAHRGREVWLIAGAGGQPLLIWLWDRGRVAVGLGLLALALWLWRATSRFGPIQAEPPLARRSMSEQIAGTAAFLWRRGPQALHAAQLRALDEAAALRLPRYTRLGPLERAAAIAATSGAAPGALERALNPNPSRGPHALAGTLALLEAVRRRLLETPRARPGIDSAAGAGQIRTEADR